MKTSGTSATYLQLLRHSTLRFKLTSKRLLPPLTSMTSLSQMCSGCPPIFLKRVYSPLKKNCVEISSSTGTSVPHWKVIYLRECTKASTKGISPNPWTKFCAMFLKSHMPTEIIGSSESCCTRKSLFKTNRKT